MENNNIIIHSITPTEFEKMFRKMIKEEFEQMNEEVQRVIGEDDLISIGTASRLLGICTKNLRILASNGNFTVYHHMKERRFNRAEILDYRNEHRINKRKP